MSDSLKNYTSKVNDLLVEQQSSIDYLTENIVVDSFDLTSTYIDNSKFIKPGYVYIGGIGIVNDIRYPVYYLDGHYCVANFYTVTVMAGNGSNCLKFDNVNNARVYLMFMKSNV